MKLVNLLFWFISKMPVEALCFAKCHLPQISVHIIMGGGFYTQVVIRRIEFLESQLQKNPLLSRNRLIKCHSTVTNKYLLHDMWVSAIGFAVLSLAEPVLTWVGWKSILSCPFLPYKETCILWVSSQTISTYRELPASPNTGFTWRHVLLSSVPISSLQHCPAALKISLHSLLALFEWLLLQIFGGDHVLRALPGSRTQVSTPVESHQPSIPWASRNRTI